MGLGKNQESQFQGNQETDCENATEAASDTYESSNLATWNEFHEKVEHLAPDEREVFTLTWYQGLSQQAIAKTLEVSQKTVSRRWQKARSDLFELLGGHLPE
jgi:RNA polymerase sigma factor (sigma-70 family)